MFFQAYHPQLVQVIDAIYNPMGFQLSAIEPDKESAEYGAYTFYLNNKKILFRIAKITPTKIGQFVTFWKRSASGPIIPFDRTDNIDFFVVTVFNKEKCGQFVFPKDTLIRQGIVSENGVGGKRAIRVYPAWDKVDNKQAEKTQAWQCNYFFELNNDNSFDIARVQELYR